MRRLELLAPARNCEIGIEAIKHGADAVYIGASSHGARSAAANSIEEISKLTDFAHKFHANIYVTLNTLIYDNEISDVEKLICQLYRIGVDALIVQDSAILLMDIPPIALHASTQCDIRTIEKALFYEKLGFSQIVVPRELNLKEISHITSALKIPVEAFVHGALCVSFSGDCRAGQMAAGRSGNRGECPQICRLPFNLIDEKGKILIEGKHLLSLHDLNRISAIGELINSGVNSFKIEGRLKDDSYVRNTVAAYRDTIDKIIDASCGELERSSQGYSTFNFSPDLSKSFNRGYTDYFHKKPATGKKFAQFTTPKMIGEEIGAVVKNGDKFLEVKTSGTINNGDGLTYFTPDERLEGFRVNRVDGNRLYYAGVKPLGLVNGSKLFRNFDKKWEDIFVKDTAVRKINVEIALEYVPHKNLIVVKINDRYGNSAILSRNFKAEKASTPQKNKRKEIFSRLGNTIWSLSAYEDNAEDLFIPVSIVGDIKRDLFILFEKTRNMNRKIIYRPKVEYEKITPFKNVITARDNVVNRLAENFYHELGIKQIEKGIEKNRDVDLTSVPVMECRYCLRNEIDECKRKGSRLPDPLFLTGSRGLKYRLEFDCDNCLMRLYRAE